MGEELVNLGDTLDGNTIVPDRDVASALSNLAEAAARPSQREPFPLV